MCRWGEFLPVHAVRTGERARHADSVQPTDGDVSFFEQLQLPRLMPMAVAM